ncbi:MAG: transposase [Pseudonocardiaceae bacterium]
MSCQRRMLTEADREKISRGIAEELEGKVIAERIGRCPSVVSRDIARHGGRAGYRAVVARRVAAEQRRRPKPRKLDADPQLRQEVVARLRAGHSPDQVAGRLRYEHPGLKARWVSHEAMVRHEAPGNRVEVGDLRRRVVAAVREKLGQSDPGNAGDGGKRS